MNTLRAAQFVNKGGFIRHDDMTYSRCYGLNEHGQPAEFYAGSETGSVPYVRVSDIFRKDWVKCDINGIEVTP